MQPLYCVIATYKRASLLRRTLLSIAACHKPANFKGVIIIENGPKRGVEKIISENAKTLKTYYFYLREANKSAALNYIIDKFGECLFYFVDDDMRLCPSALRAMAEAAAKISGRFFLGGPVGVDYEKPPQDWLYKYLPYSAKGWKLEAADVSVCKDAYFLGGNWAAVSADLRLIGGFHVTLGPSGLAGGEEKIAQMRLKSEEVVGYYVPEARSWHYVTPLRCSLWYALLRTYRHGFYEGLLKKEQGNGIRYFLQRGASIFGSIPKLPVLYLARLTSKAGAILFSVANSAGACCAFLSKVSLNDSIRHPQQLIAHDATPMKRNTISSPQFPVTLPGSFWGITAFFNPAGYANKIENYRLFRESSKKQGLKLLSVELAFGDRPFELTCDDADILIQRRTDENNILWQKESILNVGVQHLPSDCDKVVCLDCDIIFNNNAWIAETSCLLEAYVAVQSFSFAVRLPKGVYSFSDEEIKNLPQGYIPGGGGNLPSFSFAKRVSIPLAGRPGGAWALRRSFLVKHPFYDRFILGGADAGMAHAFCGDFRNNEQVRSHYNPQTYAHYLRWAEEMYSDIQGSYWYAGGVIMQLWHGDTAERLYKCRDLLLRVLEYDPEEDVRVSEDGFLEWASDKPKLHGAVKEYFRFRGEEQGGFFGSFISSELHKTKDNLDIVQKELSALKFSRTYKVAQVIRKLYTIMIPTDKAMLLWMKKARSNDG